MKMMFNYHAESNALTILRAMQRYVLVRVVPDIRHFSMLDIDTIRPDIWHFSIHVIEFLAGYPALFNA